MKLLNTIGKYPLEILIKSIRALKSSMNFSFIETNKKQPCFKTSTLNIAGKLCHCLLSSVGDNLIVLTVKYLEDPFGYYAGNIKNLLDKVKLQWVICVFLVNNS